MNKNGLRHEKGLEVANEIMMANKGILGLLNTEDQRLDGKHITVSNHTLLNYGSCSYLGLELDRRLKEGAIEAILRYGSLFASSRVYMSVTPYVEAEELLSKMYGIPVIIGQTTTLGHQAAIPIIIDNRDVVIIDARAHDSLQTTVQMLELRDIPVHTVRHNRMDLLEEKIVELKNLYRRVWFFLDGVYSVHGDLLPANEVIRLLNAHDNFYTYVDDAHGMSWAGENGTGYANSHFAGNPKVFLMSTLGKGFGVGGCAMVIPDEEIRNKVRNCGKTMVFCGQLQPALLGSIIASAKIHLSEEIVERQRDLRKKILHFNSLAKLNNLPLISESVSPICFIGAGKKEVGFNLAKRLFNDGFFIPLSTFPSTTATQSGLRVTITLHHDADDIEKLIAAISHELPKALAEENSSMDELRKYFHLNRTTRLQQAVLE